MDLKYFGVINLVKDEEEVGGFDDYFESYFMGICQYIFSKHL